MHMVAGDEVADDCAVTLSRVCAALQLAAQAKGM